MRISFRCDASLQKGSGHVMRCLTLADALRARGALCQFICRPLPGHDLELVERRGHQAIPLSGLATSESGMDVSAGTDWAADATHTRQVIESLGTDWLVVDHYDLDRRWETALRTSCEKLMVIDDLADRFHDCDALLDPGLGKTPRHYAGLVPQDCQLLLGPHQALLRPEFGRWRDASLARRTPTALEHVLLSLGGVDADNVTGRVLDAMKGSPLPADARITVVLGRHSPWINELKKLALEMPRPTEVLVDVQDMARLMTRSDLVIGAGGGSSWERCCLGVPSLMLILAENQKANAQDLQAAGAVRVLSNCTELPELLCRLSSPHGTSELQAMSKAAAALTDGLGALRVSDWMWSQHG